MNRTENITLQFFNILNMIFYHDTYSTVKHWKLLCLRVQFYKIRLERKITWTIVCITSCCEDSQPQVQNNLTFEDIFSSITYLRKSYLKSEQLTWIVNASCLLKASKTEPRQARFFFVKFIYLIKAWIYKNTK